MGILFRARLYRLAKYNSYLYKRLFLVYDMIESGRELLFEMDSQPSSYGVNPEDMPSSRISKWFIPIEAKRLFPPYPESDIHIFQTSESVVLKNINSCAKIKYTLDNSEPGIESETYSEAIPVNTSTTIRAKAYLEGFNPSTEFIQTYTKAIHNSIENPFLELDGELYPKITLPNECSPNYAGNNKHTLIDGITGSTEFSDGSRVGIQQDNLVAEINLGKTVDLKQISLRYLKNHNSWIFYPRSVNVYSSDNGIRYRLIDSIEINDKSMYCRSEICNYSLPVDANTRYLKIEAVNIETIPKWHRAEGNKTYVLADEIIIEPK